jgi:hypothetical protein
LTRGGYPPIIISFSKDWSFRLRITTAMALVTREWLSTNDPALMTKALQTAWGAYFQTWLNEDTAFWFSTPEAWEFDDPSNFIGPQYQRPRAVWELAAEVSISR